MAKKVMTNNYGIASFVLSILSCIFILFPYIGFILAILAIVFYVQQKKINVTGLAIAGLVIGIISLIINSILLLVLIGILSVMTSLLHAGIISSQENVSNISSSDLNINYVKNASLTIDKIQVQAAYLSKVRLTVSNTGDLRIYPKFDVYVYDTEGNEICFESPSINEFDYISPNDTKTGEISLLSCFFNNDGTYILKVDLLDSDYKKLDTKTKKFIVTYWNKF